MNRRLSAHSAVGLPTPHESAQLHVAGTAAYTDDLPQLEGTLHAAMDALDADFQPLDDLRASRTHRLRVARNWL